MRRPLIASVALGFATASFVVAGLTASATRASQAVHEGGTLTIGVRSLDYVDPALTQKFVGGTTTSLVSRAVTEATCSMLYRYPVATPPAVSYDLVHDGATALPAVSADGKKYTFTIRTGNRFSDGTPVTAGSYAAAINRDLNPVMRSPAAAYLQDVVGADAVQQGAAQTASGVKVAGSHLIIKLKKRVPDFTARMTTPNFCPVPARLPIDPEGAGAPIPGSGPFYVSEFVRGSRAVLERNRFYRGARAHHVDKIVVQIGDDPVANSDKVEAGSVDVDLSVPLQRLVQIGAKYPVNKGRFFSIPSTAMFYVFMNTDGPLFRHNPKLRQAVNFALDRTALLADLLQLPATTPATREQRAYFGSTADGYLPPGLPGSTNKHPYPLRHPNLKKALALAQGHKKGGKAVYYACNDVGLACIQVAETVQANLKAIGIDVEIKTTFPYTVKAAKTATRGEPFDLTDDRYDVPWVDPSQYVNPLLDGRTIQPTMNTDISYFNSAHHNGLMDRAQRLSGSARYDAYNKIAFDIAANAAPMAAFISRNLRFFVSSHVGCVTAGAHDLDLAGLCVS